MHSISLKDVLYGIHQYLIMKCAGRLCFNLRSFNHSSHTETTFSRCSVCCKGYSGRWPLGVSWCNAYWSCPNTFRWMADCQIPDHSTFRNDWKVLSSYSRLLQRILLASYLISRIYLGWNLWQLCSHPAPSSTIASYISMFTSHMCLSAPISQSILKISMSQTKHSHRPELFTRKALTITVVVLVIIFWNILSAAKTKLEQWVTFQSRTRSR